MKYETYEHITFISYLLFFLVVFVMTILSLFMEESGTFIMLVFGVWGGITWPITYVICGALSLVILLSLFKFKNLTHGLRYVTLFTLLYIIGFAFVPYLPWGGESFASVLDPLLTLVSISYIIFGVWMLFSKKYNNTSNVG